MYEALSQELILMLREMPQQFAVESLSRHAAFSPSATVRMAATRALKERPLDRYAPLLLGGMAMPIEERAAGELRISPDATGCSCYLGELWQEGPLMDVSVALEARADGSGLISLAHVGSAFFPTGWPGRFAEDYADENTARIRALCQREAEDAAVKESAALHAAVVRLNKAIETRNRQIEPVLMATTGQGARTPLGWWQWWQSYDDMYVPPRDGGRFTARSSSWKWNESYDWRGGETASGPGGTFSGQGWLFGPTAILANHTATYTPHPAPSGSSESYDAPLYDDDGRKPSYEYDLKTKVWTLTGPQAIEAIKPGDRVLSQDPDSGELAYKPVLATSYRPPGRRVVIGVGAEKIATTLGHAFWVAGEGWRMAKELKVGYRLQGLDGAVAVEGLEGIEVPLPWPEGAHELVVADFNTYFVGEHLLLVHDNTPRRPPAMAVPALLRDDAKDKPAGTTSSAHDVDAPTGK